MTRVPLDATAVPHREPGYNLLVTSVWTDPAESDENVALTRELYEAMESFMAGRRYLNYFSEDDDGDDSVQTAYGPNYERLVELKNTYDPTNLFHLNANIPPRG